MIKKFQYCFICVSLLFFSVSKAQRIIYSDPDKDDSKSINTEVIGKMNDHFIIYKSLRDMRRICLYDNDMKLISKDNLSFLPQKIINADFIAYRDYFYLIYQYQRKNVVYCKAAKFDGDAKLISEPKQLDTTAISFFASNKIYNVIFSEDKQKIDIFKVNSKNDDNYILTNSLFNQNLDLQAKTITSIPMPERNDFLSEFVVDNEGDLAFVRATAATSTAQNDNINKLSLIMKKIADNQVFLYDLNITKVYLDNVRLKADNENKHYLITSFYSKSRRGNIEGLYCSLWSKNSAMPLNTKYITFTDELRNEAKSQDASTKSAFNDYFLQNIIMRKDGGYLIAAESAYSSSRGNTLNRWDYLYGSPYWSPSDYYFYNPYSYYYPWFNNAFVNQYTRFFADNITVLSFDSSSNMQWANVIHKSQFDDNSDDLLGYTTLNTGNEIHFIFNQLERRLLLLTDQSITPDGKVQRKPTFKDLDNTHQFMPRYAKQVGFKELIIPCQYRNYICFAKLDF